MAVQYRHIDPHTPYSVHTPEYGARSTQGLIELALAVSLYNLQEFATRTELSIETPLCRQNQGNGGLCFETYPLSKGVLGLRTLC